jgi:hypothetical protein
VPLMYLYCDDDALAALRLALHGLDSKKRKSAIQRCLDSVASADQVAWRTKLSTYRYANAEYAQQTFLQEMPTLASLLQLSPLAMFDPP